MLITAGVLVLLFIGWSTWINSWLVATRQDSSAAQTGEQLLQQSQTPRATASQASAPPVATVVAGVPVEKQPANTDTVGVIYIPRFGADWKRTIRESVDVVSVLNSYTAGVGHYPGTAMPGGVGNFAIAAHDTGYGNTFLQISDLQLGDRVYIQTAQGFYTYQFRNYEYVQPTAVSVLLPVPGEPGAKPAVDQRLITMTTCNPPYHARERLIAYGTFVSYSHTAPAAIANEIGS